MYDKVPWHDFIITYLHLVWSQVKYVHELCMNVCVVNNSVHICFEAHKSMYVCAYVYEYWDFVMTTNNLWTFKREAILYEYNTHALRDLDPEVWT